MSLTENTTYSKASPAPTTKFNPLKALSNVANKVASVLPSKKSFDTSAYSGIASGVSNAAGRMDSGVKNALGTITTNFGDSTRYENYHPGVDIANKIGTEILANIEGTVTNVQTGFKQGDKGYGNSVIIKDKYGNSHRYSHLLNAYVMVGQPVKKGQIFASMGNSGSTYSQSGGTGSHLDYRIKNIFNQYVDPSPYIKNFNI